MHPGPVPVLLHPHPIPSIALTTEATGGDTAKLTLLSTSAPHLANLSHGLPLC